MKETKNLYVWSKIFCLPFFSFVIKHGEFEHEHRLNRDLSWF